MTKYIKLLSIFLLAIISFNTTYAQEPATPYGNQLSASKFPGKVYIDGALYIPVFSDTPAVGNLYRPKRNGAIVLRQVTLDSADTYIFIGNQWRKINNSGIDLSGYAQLSTPQTFHYTQTFADSLLVKYPGDNDSSNQASSTSWVRKWVLSLGYGNLSGRDSIVTNVTMSSDSTIKYEMNWKGDTIRETKYVLAVGPGTGGSGSGGSVPSLRQVTNVGDTTTTIVIDGNWETNSQGMVFIDQIAPSTARGSVGFYDGNPYFIDRFGSELKLAWMNRTPGQVTQFTIPISGTATLSSGTVTVNNIYVSSGSKIYVSYNTPSGTQGFLSAPQGSIISNTSFVINSSSSTDNSTVNWTIIN